jgi:hypothetical protein
MRRLPLFALALPLLWLALRLTVWTPPGFTRTVYPEVGERGPATVTGAADVDLSFMPVPHGPRRFFSARWRGVWHVDAGPGDAGDYLVYLGADDWARLTIDGQVVAERGRGLGYGTVSVPVHLYDGPHAIEVQYEQEGGGAFLTTGWSEPGGERRDFADGVVFPQPVDTLVASLINRAVGAVGWGAAVAVAGLAAWLAALGGQRLRRDVADDPAGWRGLGARGWAALARRERWLSAAGLALILALGGALRLDAIMVRYGPFDRPHWLAETEIHTRDRIEGWLRPHSFSWAKIAVPYVGGDPINYLGLGRQMTSFYAASVREPMFPAAVHVWLRLLDDHDVAVSFASATFSFLAIAATWWLGRMTYGAWVGLLAALGLAMDKDAITWAADGWRDDAVLFFATAVAVALLGLARKPAWPWGVGLGIAAAGAVLTRVTLLSLIVPGALLVVALGRGRLPLRLRATALAAALALALAAPYFYACWKTFGDPLHSINVHTSFYRARAGDDSYRTPMSAGAYLRARAAADPIGTATTGAIGLFWFPFENKWIGFDYWYPGLRRFLMGMAAVGLLLLATTRRGLFLWALLLATLLPYAFTWSIPGGGEWRFTLPAYPFYLIAAALALVTTARRLPAFAARARAWVG